MHHFNVPGCHGTLVDLFFDNWHEDMQLWTLILATLVLSKYKNFMLNLFFAFRIRGTDDGIVGT